MEKELLLESLQIKGFRAFEDLQVPRLGRVNLITGKNNVGKTCLLEALQVYARRGEPNVLSGLLIRRDETYYSGNMKTEETTRFLESVRNVFHGRPASFEECRMEVGSLNHASNRVSIHLEKIDFEDEDLERWRKAVKERTFVRRTTQAAELVREGVMHLIIRLGSEEYGVPFLPQYFRSPLVTEILGEALKHTFVWAKGLDASLLAQWWDGVTLTPFEDEVTKALNLVAPSVSAVSFVNRSTREGNPERMPVVKVASRATPIPMKSLGEGVNRMFGLALALVSSRDGLLMVDEIETGLHYSVQADMWRLVFATARALNVQVFATTHSKDCIDAFEEAAREDEETEGVLIRLQEKSGVVSAVSFDERRLEIATREDIEVR